MVFNLTKGFVFKEDQLTSREVEGLRDVLNVIFLMLVLDHSGKYQRGLEISFSNQRAW